MHGGIKIIMNDKLKELIQPYWAEEQQGVYIPLIDKVITRDGRDVKIIRIDKKKEITQLWVFLIVILMNGIPILKMENKL